MKINFIKKNIEIDQINFVEFAEEKIERFSKKKKNIDEIKVSTTFEKHSKQSDNDFVVEIILFSKGDVISVKGASDSQIKAFDVAFDKLEKIVRREHSKSVSKKQY